jgi:hypothetical protein
MNKHSLVNIAAFAVGLALGPSGLGSVRAAHPPIDAHAILFALSGCLIAAVFVLGIQILRKDPRYARWALRVFGPVSIAVLGSGFGALASDSLDGGVEPPGLLLLAIGVGLLTGKSVSGALFRARYKRPL